MNRLGLLLALFCLPTIGHAQDWQRDKGSFEGPTKNGQPNGFGRKHVERDVRYVDPDTGQSSKRTLPHIVEGTWQNGVQQGPFRIFRNHPVLGWQLIEEFTAVDGVQQGPFTQYLYASNRLRLGQLSSVIRGSYEDDLIEGEVVQEVVGLENSCPSWVINYSGGVEISSRETDPCSDAIQRSRHEQRQRNAIRSVENWANLVRIAGGLPPISDGVVQQSVIPPQRQVSTKVQSTPPARADAGTLNFLGDLPQCGEQIAGANYRYRNACGHRIISFNPTGNNTAAQLKVMQPGDTWSSGTDVVYLCEFPLAKISVKFDDVSLRCVYSSADGSAK